MDELKKANNFINENKIPKEELPVFHAAPTVGWMNDPNGFSVYRGRAHLFYQHNPYSNAWGPMHWGHCVSDDFIKWESLPVAMAPDSNCDSGGCYSGSAVETKQGHVLAYTGIMPKERGGKLIRLQNQCIAVGDGITYEKFPLNPVITGDMLPDGFSRTDFRDPKIFKEQDGYYMAVGNKTLDGIPQIVLFRSNDLKKWEYVSVLARDTDRKLGTMWECPDFFSIGKQYMLIISPMKLRADEEFHNGNNSICLIGDYDREKHKFDYGKAVLIDGGLDFYAPQTTLAPDGRRIMIGWMQSWDSNIRPANQKWACMMTLPRELRVIDGQLIQNPVREIENYRTDPVVFENEKIEGRRSFNGINGRILDMTVELISGDCREFTVYFAQSKRFQTSLTYRRDKNFLELDRTYCGMDRDVAAFRRVKIKNPKERIRLRFIMDKFSVEIFVNGGEQVLTSTFYTPLEADGISFECDKPAQISITKYTIKVD